MPHSAGRQSGGLQCSRGGAAATQVYRQSPLRGVSGSSSGLELATAPSEELMLELQVLKQRYAPVQLMHRLARDISDK